MLAAGPAARRSRDRVLRQNASIIQLSWGPTPTTCQRSLRFAPLMSSNRVLGVASRLSLPEELPDLFDRVFDFHVERHLAERRRRRTGVTGDAVVHAGRCIRIGLSAPATAFAWRRDRITDGRLEQIFADPPLVCAEVDHLRRVRNGCVAAARVALPFEVLVEVVLRL